MIKLSYLVCLYLLILCSVITSSPIRAVNAAPSTQQRWVREEDNNSGSRGRGRSSRANENNKDDDESNNSSSSWEYLNKYLQQKNDRNKPRGVLEAAVSAIKTLLCGGLMAGTSFVGFPLGAIAATFLSGLQTVKDKANSNSSTSGTITALVIFPTLGLIFGGIVGGTSALGICLYSIFRAASTLIDGIQSTPETFKQKFVERRVWDPFERRFVNRTISLHHERQELLSKLERQEKEAGERRKQRRVADTKLYDLLDVPPDASKGMIKKAYFAKAKDVHPDKNRDDPSAHQKFIQLHEAYSILSDDDKRAEYDMKGKASSGSGQSMSFDASVFVAVFFSGDEGFSGDDGDSGSSSVVENYIGELSLTSFIDNSYRFVQILQFMNDKVTPDGNDQQNLNDDLFQFIQEFFIEHDNKNEIRRRMRSIEIASYLVNKTSSLFDAAPKDSDTGADTGTCDNIKDRQDNSLDSCLSPEQRFRNQIYKEAKHILNSSNFYGKTYLQIIGSSLLSEASLWKTLLLPLGVRETYSKWYSRKEYAQAFYRLCVNFSKEKKKAGASSSESSNKRFNDNGSNNNKIQIDDNSLVNSLPDLMRLISVYNKVDISSTLREMTWRLMNDPSASILERRNRLRTMKIIGQVFIDLANKVDEEQGGGVSNLNDNENNNGFHQETMEEIKSRFILAFNLATKQKM